MDQGHESGVQQLPAYQPIYNHQTEAWESHPAEAGGDAAVHHMQLQVAGQPVDGGYVDQAEHLSDYAAHHAQAYYQQSDPNAAVADWQVATAEGHVAAQSAVAGHHQPPIYAPQGTGMQGHCPPVASKSSRFRGVYKRQRGGRWEASIVLESKNCRLGLHLTEEAAARAYDRVAIRKWGPEEASSKINFPLEQYDLQQIADTDIMDLVAAVRSEWRKNLEAAGLAEKHGHEHHYPLDPVDENDPNKRQRTGEDPQQWAVTANITGGHYNAAPLQGIEGETTERIPIPRSSIYRGVSTHKQSGKWVAQIKAHGKQVYLGFYAEQADAARAYDQVIIHLQGEQAHTNFPPEEYTERWEELRETPLNELVANIKNTARGGLPRTPKGDASKYRGVAPDKSNKWRAQITTGSKSTVYLGLWPSEVSAAQAYDRASIAKRGKDARTNFPKEDYAAEMETLQGMVFQDLVNQLRAQAVATVAADRVARHTGTDQTYIIDAHPGGPEGVGVMVGMEAATQAAIIAGHMTHMTDPADAHLAQVTQATYYSQQADPTQQQESEPGLTLDIGA